MENFCRVIRIKEHSADLIAHRFCGIHRVVEKKPAVLGLYGRRGSTSNERIPVSRAASSVVVTANRTLLELVGRINILNKDCRGQRVQDCEPTMDFFRKHDPVLVSFVFWRDEEMRRPVPYLRL